MKSLLTASRTSKLLSCPRAHYLSYEVCLKPVSTADYFSFGHAWHTGMQHRWMGAPIEAALAAALPDNGPLDVEAAHTVAGLLRGYYAKYGDTDALVKQIHPEVEFRTPIKGSLTFDSAGKIDGLAVLHDGRQALVEHKTAGEDISNDSDYWLRLRFNQQVLNYVLAARQLGWDIRAVVYDVVRKPMIRVKQNETVDAYEDRLVADMATRPDFYLARKEVPILDQDLEEFEVQRLVISRQILSYRAAEKKVRRREQAWPRNVNMMQCRSCSYSQFCLQNTPINLEQPPAGFRVGPAHSELETIPTA